MGAKKDELSSGQVWDAGFHRVTACSVLAGFWNLWNIYFLIFKLFFGLQWTADTESADTEAHLYVFPCLDRIQSVGFRFPCSRVWRLKVQIVWDVIPCCVDPDVWKACGALCFNGQGFTYLKGAMFFLPRVLDPWNWRHHGPLLWWNHSTSNMASRPWWLEPSAVLLWKPKIFCECEKCCLVCCDSMYSGSRVTVCLKATLHDVNRLKTIYIGAVVPVYQTTWFRISEHGSLLNHDWSVYSQLLYL
jgi:hypothetical protein